MKGIAYVGAALLIGNLSFAAVYADQIGDKAKPLEIAEWVKGKKMSMSPMAKVYM